MQNCRDWIASLLRQGVRLWVENGELRFQAPKGALLPEARDELRRRRVEVIQLLEKEDRVEEIPLQRREANCSIPLTAMQRRRWLRRQEERRYRLRTSVSATRVLGHLEVTHLEASLCALVRRHEPLRTRIIATMDTPYQQIDPPAAYHLDLIDLSDMTTEESEQNLQHIAEAFISEEVDFSVGPLFSTKLVKLSDTDHVFLMALNHMITDGASYGILRTEIWLMYELSWRGQDLRLPPVDLQFGDYAVWQHNNYGAWMCRHAPYWRDHLWGAEPGRLPICTQIAESQISGGTFRIEFGKELTAAIHHFAQLEQCLPSLVVFAVYTALMSMWTGQRDFLVRMVVDARYRPELESMIGFVASHLYLRIRRDPEETFRESLKRVQREFYAAYDHLDFDRLPDFISECAETEIHFNWIAESRWFNESHREAVGPLTLQAFPLRTARILNFTPFFLDSNAGIVGIVQYREDRFSSDVLTRFGDGLQHLTRVCVKSPDLKIQEILTWPSDRR